MKPKKKLTLAKIELHLFALLEETNKKFTDSLKNSLNSNKEQTSFQDYAQSYEAIMKLIENNRKRNNVSDLLESYYLEAWLSKIQSDFNGLPIDPPNEDVVLSNDKKIEELTKSLTHLNSKTEYFKLHNKKNIAHALHEDYRDLLNEINAYFSSWDKTINQFKAGYYYNCAEALIKETTSKNSDYDLKKNLFESAICCLEFSDRLYQEVGSTEDARETLGRKNEIEKQLNLLKKSQKYSLKRKKISTKPENSSSLTKKNQTEPFNKDTLTVASAVPPEKRKNWIIPDEEQPDNKRPYIPPREKNLTINALLESEESKEKIVQQKTAQYKKMFTQAVGDPFRFYGRLFFDLTLRLQVLSKESSNHTLLTKLSWLTIAKELIGLTSNKNAADNTEIAEIANNISLLSTLNQENLKIISSQKRDQAYPTYAALDLKYKDLQNLFIEEVTDYYYGLEALIPNSGAMSFLDLIPNIIKKHSFANPLKEIENTIQSVDKPIENLFYAKLLRELVKFHICNPNWRNETFAIENQINLNNEYFRILSISERFAKESGNIDMDLITGTSKLKTYLLEHFPPEKSSTQSDNTYPTSIFFQPPKQIESPSTELLNITLREHFQCLVTCRAPSIHSETIYDHLLQFIQTHCKQKQAGISHSRAHQP